MVYWLGSAFFSQLIDSLGDPSIREALVKTLKGWETDAEKIGKGVANTFVALASNTMSGVKLDQNELGARFSEVIKKFITSFDSAGISGQAGDKTTDLFLAFLKNFNTSKIAGAVGQQVNTGTNSFWEQLNLAEASQRSGKEIRDAMFEFSKPVSEGIKEVIDKTLRQAASAVSWSVLPYVGAAIVVNTVLPLSIYYSYCRAKHYIGSPKVATEIHQRGIHTPLTETIGNVSSLVFGSTETKPIYNAEITRRITDLINSVKNIRQNGGYFQNVLFYGPGGTGKTMISEYIAKNSGMSYIKMSGGDLAQYIKRGEHVTELNKLLDKIETSWRPWSNRPWILFIDEAESLCRDRSKIPTTELLELQNALLNRTGTQSRKFMMLLSTNRMEDLDEAILSRMDHKVFIGLPAKKERADIIALYAPQFFSKSEQADFFKAAQIANMAKNTDGLSGRAIFKILNAVAGKKAASADFKLTQEMIDITIKDVISQEEEVARRRAQKEQVESRNYPTLIHTHSTAKGG